MSFTHIHTHTHAHAHTHTHTHTHTRCFCIVEVFKGSKDYKTQEIIAILLYYHFNCVKYNQFIKMILITNTFLSPLPPSLHLSSHHSLSLPLPFADRSVTQTTAVHEKRKETNTKVFSGIKVAQRRQKWGGRFLREVLNCERELLCGMWGERLFQTRGAWTENANDLWPKPSSSHLALERGSFCCCWCCFFPHQKWNGEYETECTHRGRMTGMVAEYHQRNQKQRWLSWRVSFPWREASEAF